MLALELDVNQKILCYTSFMQRLSFIQRLRKILFIVVTVLIVGIVILAIIQLKNIFSPQGYRFDTSSKTVVKELRELSRLETASFTVEKVIDAGTSGNRFQELLFGDKLLLIAQGEVIAGFDLSTLEDDAAEVSDQTLRITLPPPQILVTDLDNSETRVFDRRQGLLTKGDQNLEAEARQEAERIITEGACTGGILNEATQNARSQLTALFKTLGFTSVTIDIPSGSC